MSTTMVNGLTVTTNTPITTNGKNDSVPSSQCAPLELITQFVSAVMRKQFVLANTLCQHILKLEPDNETCKEFRTVLDMAIKQEEEEEEEEDEEGDEKDGTDSQDESSDNDDESSDTSSDENTEEDDDDDDEDDEEEDDDDTDTDEMSSSEDEDEDLTIDEVNRLNLLMGGLSVVKKGV